MQEKPAFVWMHDLCVKHWHKIIVTEEVLDASQASQCTVPDWAVCILTLIQTEMTHAACILQKASTKARDDLTVQHCGYAHHKVSDLISQLVSLICLTLSV